MKRRRKSRNRGYHFHTGPSVDGRDRLYFVKGNTILRVWVLPKIVSFKSWKWGL